MNQNNQYKQDDTQAGGSSDQSGSSNSQGNSSYQNDYYTDPSLTTGTPSEYASFDLSGFDIPLENTNTESEFQAAPPQIPELDTQGFDVPKMVMEQYKDILEMILITKSMDKKEKQYWLHILPIMSPAQVTKLRNILLNEKNKLASINKNFSEKMATAHEEGVAKWEEDDYKRKMQKLKEEEASEESKEQAAEEDLLASLENI